MGDHMYEYGRSTCSSSTSTSSPPDDLSVFLQQILLRSSSSSVSSSTSLMAHISKDGQSSMPSTSMAGLCSTSTTGENLHPSQGPTLFQNGILAVDSTNGGSTLGGVRLSALPSYNVTGTSAANVSSSSMGVSENETDEYDCESEENAEAWVEELPVKPVPPRSSSKRSRAAEVHNLSEKRRRSRINEKMKALQNLIPNSNKTDKASMLDEAIEYLKQLQLQVQMLSMRNGMTLHPVCLPGALQHIPLSQMRMECGEENRSLPLNLASILPLQQDNLIHEVHGLVNQCTTLNPPPVPSLTYLLNTDTSELDSSIQSHLRPFQLQRTSEGMSREDIFQHQQLNAIHSQTQSLEVHSGCSLLSSFIAQTSDLKDKNTFETCITGRGNQAPEMANRKTQQNLVIPTSQLSRNCYNFQAFHQSACLWKEDRLQDIGIESQTCDIVEETVTIV